MQKRFVTKQKRKHTWFGAVCAVCMMLSFVMAVPITALADDRGVSIGSVGIDLEIDLRTDETLQYGAEESNANYIISEQGWYEDGVTTSPNHVGEKPEATKWYCYCATLEANSGYYFPSDTLGYYAGSSIRIGSSTRNCYTKEVKEDGKKLVIQTTGILPANYTSGSPSGTTTEEGNTSNSSTSGSISDSTSHTHSFAWRTIVEPTASQDGLEAYACTSCGYYAESNPISAHSYVCNEGTNQILSAVQGSELILDMGNWCSYPKWFMEKIADRRDLTVRIQFEYEHKKYEVVIPANAVVDTQCDWYGPLKLCSLYPYTVEEQ